jgi:hypothetical protein
MIDSLANSIAGEIFSTEGTAHPSMGMPQAQMVAHAYGYHTREWVGLTQEDKSLFSSWLDHKTDAEVFEAIEAKLKEKNT